MRIIIFTITLIACLTSAAIGNAQTSRQQAFISRFAKIAQEEMKQHGIPASIKLAQAIIESSWGESELAMKANNYFGIKCRTNTCIENAYQKVDDDTDASGKSIPSYFMTFSNPQASFMGHSSFLVDNSRYTRLFQLKSDDYKAWAKGLQTCRYATSPTYAKKIIGIIEKYNLQKFDIQVINGSQQLALSNSALDALQQTSAPSNPLHDGQITNEALKAQPITTFQNIPSAPENPAVGTATASTDNELPAGIHQESFGSYDVKDYQPAYKTLLEEGDSTKGGKTKIEKLKSYPKKEMIGGDASPR